MKKWKLSVLTFLLVLSMGITAMAAGEEYVDDGPVRFRFNKAGELTAMFNMDEMGEKDGNVMIPSRATAIAITGDVRSEYFMEHVTKITIPSGVTRIGARSFIGYNGLKEVVITGDVTSIESAAFASCTSLERFIIPSRVKRIEQETFDGCTSLKSIHIPPSVTAIEAGAFRNCTSLSSITIPSNVTVIGAEAFKNCTSLKSITIPSNVHSIEEGAFEGCTNLKTVKIENGLSSIGKRAFEKCSSLKEITIPSSVRSIEEEAFRYCENLTVVTLSSGLESIGTRAFSNNSCLNEIVIPEGVTTLGEAVCVDCTKLSKVWLPASITTNGYNAFAGCLSLTDIYYAGSENDWIAVFGYHVNSIHAPDNVTIHYSESNPSNSDGSTNDNQNSNESTDNGQDSNGTTNQNPSDSNDTIDNEQGSSGAANQNPGSDTVEEISVLPVVATKYNTLQISWSKVQEAKYYEVYYSISKDMSDARRLAKTGKLSYKFTKAVCGQTYYFQVKAYQKSGKTTKLLAASPVMEGKTYLMGEVKLSAKTTYHRVTLKWKRIKGAKLYEVYRASSDGIYQYITTVKSASYTDKSVETGVHYNYYIKAISDRGLEQIDSNTISAYPALKAAPKAKTKVLGADGLRLVWNKVAGAKYYVVYRLDAATGTYEILDTVYAPTCFYIDTNLKASTVYTYKVEAVAGSSRQESRPVQGMTKAWN